MQLFLFSFFFAILANIDAQTKYSTFMKILQNFSKDLLILRNLALSVFKSLKSFEKIAENHSKSKRVGNFVGDDRYLYSLHHPFFHFPHNLGNFEGDWPHVIVLIYTLYYLKMFTLLEYLYYLFS